MNFWVVVSLDQQGETQSDQQCGVSLQANQLAQLIITHPSQKRPLLQCDQLLVTIAQQRAEQLANNRADPDITSNQILIKGGFRVPNYYPVTGNQVEAVARDFNQADQAFQYLNQSHRSYLHYFNKSANFSSRKNYLVIHTFLQSNHQSKVHQAMV